MRASGPLTADELGDLADATLANSIDLIHDAEGLFAFNRWPIANSVAILAAEELGKNLMCLGALTTIVQGRENWPGFWREFYDHKPKFMYSLDMVIATLSAEAKDAAKQTYDRYVDVARRFREGGLYVDFDTTNRRSVAPTDAISIERADESIGMWSNLVTDWATYWRMSAMRSAFSL